MNKASRFVALLLAILSLSDIFAAASAEPARTVDDPGYKPMAIPSIYNMSTEQANSELDNYNGIRLIRIMIRQVPITLPAYSMVYGGLVADNDKRKESLFDISVGNALLQSEFEKEFDPIGLNTLFMLFKEISSNKAVGYLDVRKNVFVFAKAFFSELAVSDFEDEIDYLGLYLLDEYIDLFYHDEYVYDFTLLFRKPKTVAEYKRRVYEKYVDKNEWPVHYQIEMNVNETLPKLKDELLNADLSRKYLVLLRDVQEQKVIRTIICYSDEKMNMRDIFTDEIIDKSNSFDVNSKYEKKWKLPKGLMVHRRNLDGKEHFGFNGLTSELNSTVPLFQKVRTIEDAINAYQYIPKDLQMDYSNYDFSKSPNVDPAWLDSRPVPTPPLNTALTIGSSGLEVLALKQRFYELGYFRTTEFSDQFNKNTADTVKLFEKNNGLKVDGIADAEMLDVLFSDSAVGK